jgi:hypothetical protein
MEARYSIPAKMPTRWSGTGGTCTTFKGAGVTAATIATQETVKETRQWEEKTMGMDEFVEE